jgi:hypothetical protein
MTNVRFFCRLFVWKLLLEEALYPNNRGDSSKWKERTYEVSRYFLQTCKIVVDASSHVQLKCSFRP